MKKLKLYKTLADETWFVGERDNQQAWIQQPVESTNWNNWFEEEFEVFSNLAKSLKEYEADATEIKFCYQEINVEEFLLEYDFESLNLDCDQQQESLNYYCDYGWTEIAIKLIENPAYTDGELVDITYTYDELA